MTIIAFYYLNKWWKHIKSWKKTTCFSERLLHASELNPISQKLLACLIVSKMTVTHPIVVTYVRADFSLMVKHHCPLCLGFQNATCIFLSAMEQWCCSLYYLCAPLTQDFAQMATLSTGLQFHLHFKVKNPKMWFVSDLRKFSHLSVPFSSKIIGC